MPGYAFHKKESTGGLEHQDLEWGVLVMNTDMPRYEIGQNVEIVMAVLDHQGDMVCDAKLRLEVINEQHETVKVLSTDDQGIMVTKECRSKEVHSKPDFYAHLTLAVAGWYKLKLTAETSSGIKEIEEFILIKERKRFFLKRKAPSRINPEYEYDVVWKLRARERFRGDFLISMPMELQILPPAGCNVGVVNGRQQVTCAVDLKPNRSYKIKYKYKAPETKSPWVYEFGPAVLRDERYNEVFNEGRTWKVAVDPRIRYGTASQFEANATSQISSAELTTDKFVICYTDSGAAGQCRVGSVSGTTITWGTEAQFAADVVIANSRVGVCKIDTDKFAVVYTDDSLLDDGYTVVGTVSGTTITYGTAVEFHDVDVEFQGCVGIATDKYLIAYNDETTSDTGTGVACSVSGTTITVGTVNDYAATDYFAQYNAPSKLDTDKFVVAFHGADSSDGFVVAGTTSGTTITWGTVVTVSTDDVNGLVTCAPTATDKFLNVYRNVTNTALEAVVGTTSATITLGSVTDINPTSQDSGYPGCTFVSDTQALVYFPDVGGASSNGVSRLCDVDWTARTITCRPQQTFAAVDILSATTTDQSAIETIANYGSTTSAKVVLGYLDTPTSVDGYAIVGEIGPLLGSVMVVR